MTAPRVGIIGIGQSVFRPRRDDASYPDLVREAVVPAMDQAGIDFDAIDGIVYASEIEGFNSQEPGVLECREILDKYYPRVQLDWGSMLGYAHARLLVGTLEAMGTDITRDGLVEALEGTDGVVTGTTAPMGFSPTNHNSAKALKIFQYENELPVAKTDWIDVSSFTAE